MRHWPKFPRPPPSLRNLWRTKLGHLVCFETPSLPLKFGTYISFFYEFSIIINSERRIETVIQLSNFWPKSSKFLLAQFVPSWEWSKNFCDKDLQTPSLPLKFGTYISFFYEFSMIINSERRIETVIQLSNFWPKLSKFLLAQFAPSWEQRESLNYSKIHKTWAWWAKIYCILFVTKTFWPPPS